MRFSRQGCIFDGQPVLTLSSEYRTPQTFLAGFGAGMVTWWIELVKEMESGWFSWLLRSAASWNIEYVGWLEANFTLSYKVWVVRQNAAAFESCARLCWNALPAPAECVRVSTGEVLLLHDNFAWWSFVATPSATQIFWWTYWPISSLRQSSWSRFGEIFSLRPRKTEVGLQDELLRHIAGNLLRLESFVAANLGISFLTEARGKTSQLCWTRQWFKTTTRSLLIP